MSDTKLAVILKDSLLTWQKLNVTAFLMSGIGGTQDIIGEPYSDGDGITYLPMARQPIMIYATGGELLRELLPSSSEKQRGLPGKVIPKAVAAWVIKKQ